jgi:hypothetical protein
VVVEVSHLLLEAVTVVLEVVDTADLHPKELALGKVKQVTPILVAVEEVAQDLPGPQVVLATAVLVLLLSVIQHQPLKLSKINIIDV